jgi:hypothetical protein
MNRLTALAARQAVTDRVIELFVATDEKAWDRVRACFADRVHFDVSSAGGRPAGEVKAEAIVDGWRRGLAPLEAVHHQMANFRVELSEPDPAPSATLRCHGVAWHWLRNLTGQNSRTFVGSFTVGLRAPEDADPTDPAAWQIHRFRFDLKFVDGNPDLEAYGGGGGPPREV